MALLEISVVVLHALGTFLIAIALIQVAVLATRYWLRYPKRMLTPFFKTPLAGTLLLIYAIAFIFVFLTFIISVAVKVSPSNQLPRLAGLTVLFLASIGAFISMRRFEKRLVNGEKK